MNLTPVRTLTLPPGIHPRGQPHLSSASGLVCIGQWAYVIADDEHHLGMFRLDGSEDGRLIRLIDGAPLPADAAARKAVKPDLETLFVTPPFAGNPHGALMAFGSGSKGARHRAVWLSLDPAGQPHAPPHGSTLEALYAPLHARFADLNIEGAFVDHDHLRLLQRGHAGAPENACIVFDWPAIAAWLEGACAPEPVAIQTFDLGAVDGVPLCFTDGAPMGSSGWVFTAVAEDTDSTYLDGACVGAAIGTVDADGHLRTVQRLSRPWKVEGINAVRDGLGWRLRVVTDADDPATASVLLETHWR